MTMVRITLDGRTEDMDLSRFMLSEAIVLEEYAGVDVQQLGALASLQSVKMMAALLWLVRLRSIAAEQNLSIRKAAAQLPYEDFDVDMAALSIEVVEAVDPPVPTRTPRTRTPPGGSSRPRPRTKTSATGKSAASPST